MTTPRHRALVLALLTAFALSLAGCANFPANQPTAIPPPAPAAPSK